MEWGTFMSAWKMEEGEETELYRMRGKRERRGDLWAIEAP